MWQRVVSGRRIGSYELKEEIGRGGSAVVFRALHANLGHAVAIKIIAAGFASDATFQERFRQEADLISRLDHPNILRVLDSGETSGEDPLLFSAFAYLVTEYMPGGSLAQEIKRERSRRQRCVLALTVAKHIGAALDYAHGSGVLHRDIKPSNVFVDGDGRFVLGDFGLARALQSSEASLHLTATGLVAGTPAYMAPEQALGEPADSRTDLYGLAVVLYQIITGRVPFEAETPLATMLAHVHQPPPSPREVAPKTPLAVEAVLLRALAKARDERYGSGNELTRALRAAVLAAYGPASVDDAVEPDAYHSTPATASAALLHFPSSKAGMAARRPRSPRRLPKAARLLLVGVGALATFSSVGAGAAAYVLGPGRAPVAAFAERFALSSTEPTWTDAWPKQGAVNQSLQTSISIRFSHDMDRESVESAITLSPDVPVSFSWDRRALTLTPLEEMREGTEYV
ncbi:MAG TPA: protein kinase, partial [Chloroflexota bacterium]|nr:protein kinase [Chloroflexota bacterium]